MQSFAYVNATSVDKVASLLGRTWDEAQVIAGGTDLVGELKEHLISPKRVVNLKTIPGLSYIRQDAVALRIGALTTIADIESNPIVQKQFAALSQAAMVIASPQIRNVGTIGGNICQRPRCWYYRSEDFPCLKKGGDRCYAVAGINRYHAIFGGGPSYIVHPSDSAPALMALNGRVKIMTSTGPKEVGMDDFFTLPETSVRRENILKPNEIITEIILPNPTPNAKSLYLKVRERQSIDFALVSVAAMLTVVNGVCQEARIVLGGVAPIPWRTPDAETFLRGKKISEAVANSAAEAALEGAKPMRDNAYKVTIAKALVRRAVMALG
ncbi:MAG: xanthine dehydrogenase family protein subunit M [Candidatus Latescibacteria bacterium]|nr:xanthine dehydrogenase family protein subunit M [Candidatus Latescibacterota bacterium]